jgi:hypothetical protein
MLRAMDLLRRNLIVPNLLAALVIFCLAGGGYALASSDVSNSQAVVAAPQTASENEQEAGTPDPEASTEQSEPEHSQSGEQQLTTHSHGASAHKHGNGNGHGRHGHHADQAGSEAEHGGGPPPWAPAHGWRCQQAGNAPGSAAFKACIKGQID